MLIQQPISLVRSLTGLQIWAKASLHTHSAETKLTTAIT
jgi:hypothetical protein